LTSISADHDPALEKELEEIALDSRSRMIGGTPSKAGYDLEKGKAQQTPSPPIATAAQKTFVEDEADKSGHGFLTASSKPQTSYKKKLVLILVLLGLLGITGGLLYTLLTKENTSKDRVPSDDEDQALTNRQQAIHNILAQTTNPGVLSDPNTPQYDARRWLLFRDTDLIDVSEESVVQRYALACFYFATGGVGSWGENNWLDGYECEDEAWDGINCSPKGEVRAIAFGKLANADSLLFFKV
jgi:hypothetical protein